MPSIEKFHQYTKSDGQKVFVQSDRKPFENIVRKPLLHAPKRLQRMSLQKYDFVITHVPVKEMLLEDAMSRAYLEDTAQEGLVEKEIECEHDSGPPDI